MPRAIRRRSVLPAGALLLLASTGCHRDSRPTIGVVPKGANHIFWQTVHAGAVKAGREFGYRIEWNAPALEIDASRQIEIVESMVTRRLAGIVLAPVDRKALVAVVERAGREKIPVAIFDSAIDTDRYISYVATNNEEGGRIAARRLGEILGGKGKAAVIGFMPGSGATMEREHGFSDEMKKKFPRMEMVAMVFGGCSLLRGIGARVGLHGVGGCRYVSGGAADARFWDTHGSGGAASENPRGCVREPRVWVAVGTVACLALSLVSVRFLGSFLLGWRLGIR